MLSLSQLMGVPVVEPRGAGRDRGPDEAERLARLGKVHDVVFSPDGLSVVGLLVKRPDVAGMIKRDDLFLGIDAMAPSDEGIACTRGRDSFDERARRRLGLDWDACLIWGGMDVRTRSGKVLGHVTDVSFNARDGRVEEVSVSDGGVANALVGSVVLPASMVRGYRDGFMVVDDEAAQLGLSGGAAARAGEAAARARATAEEAGHKAAKAAGQAVERGSRSLGRAIGKARRAVREATQDEPAVPEVAVDEASVTEAEPRALASGGHGRASSGRTYAPAGVAKRGAKGKNVGTKAASGHAGRPSGKGKAKAARGTDKAAKDVARLVGRQLGRTKGMFASFKEEFDKSSL